MYLTPEGDRKAHYFDTWKDLVIPGMEADERLYLARHRQGLVDSPPQRKYLAMFRGTIDHREGDAYSRGLRPRLKKIFANISDVIYDTKRKDCNRDCYVQEMAESVFCLNPLGGVVFLLFPPSLALCFPISSNMLSLVYTFLLGSHLKKRPLEHHIQYRKKKRKLALV